MPIIKRFKKTLSERRSEAVKDGKIEALRKKIDEQDALISNLAEKLGYEIRKVDETEAGSQIFEVTKIADDMDGSAEHPFEWEMGIKLIPNAYYTHNSIRYVWMGASGISDSEPFDDGGAWAEF